MSNYLEELLKAIVDFAHIPFIFEFGLQDEGFESLDVRYFGRDVCYVGLKIGDLLL